MIDFNAKRERLKSLAELLDGDVRSAADIAHKYKEKYKKNISPKIALLNLLELYVWVSEGMIEVNIKVRLLATSSGYVFWREEKK